MKKIILLLVLLLNLVPYITDTGSLKFGVEALAGNPTNELPLNPEHPWCSFSNSGGPCDHIKCYGKHIDEHDCTFWIGNCCCGSSRWDCYEEKDNTLLETCVDGTHLCCCEDKDCMQAVYDSNDPHCETCCECGKSIDNCGCEKCQDCGGVVGGSNSNCACSCEKCCECGQNISSCSCIKCEYCNLVDGGTKPECACTCIICCSCGNKLGGCICARCDVCGGVTGSEDICGCTCKTCCECGKNTLECSCVKCIVCGGIEGSSQTNCGCTCTICCVCNQKNSSCFCTKCRICGGVVGSSLECGCTCPDPTSCCCGLVGCTINHCSEAPKCEVAGCGKILEEIGSCSCGPVCQGHTDPCIANCANAAHCNVAGCGKILVAVLGCDCGSVCLGHIDPCIANCANAAHCQFAGCGKILTAVSGCDCGSICPGGHVDPCIAACAAAEKCTFPGCGKVKTAVADCSCDVCPGGHPPDCANVPGGTAKKDDCGDCAGGTTNKTPCTNKHVLDSLFNSVADSVRFTVDQIIAARAKIAALKADTAKERYYLKLQFKPPYHNQRNNKSKGKNDKGVTVNIGDVMCNLTILAQCFELIGKKNPNDTIQFEDYLEKLRVDKKYEARTTIKARDSLAKQLNLKQTSGNLRTPPKTRQQKIDLIKAQLKKGNAVLLSAWEPKGHILRVMAIDANGITLDDPYGKAVDHAKRNESKTDTIKDKKTGNVLKNKAGNDSTVTKYPYSGYEKGGKSYFNPKNSESDKCPGKKNTWTWVECDAAILKYVEFYKP